MIGKFFLTVSFYTLVSRISGFVRDIFIAKFLGTGPIAEAFLVALRLPNFFRRFFAEGAFNAAFIPLFSKELEQGGSAQATEFAKRIFAFLFVSLLVMVIIFEIFMPYLFFIFAPGFKSSGEIFELSVALTRITFPYLALISIATLFAGMLNSVGKFAAVAFMPVYFNLVMIIALLFFKDSAQTPAHVLAWALLVSGLVQIIWMIYFIKKENLLIHLSFKNLKLDPSVREFFKKFFPGAMGAGITQVNLWVDTVIATFFSGAVAYLYYAERVSQLPLSIVATAMGTAMLPTLSRKIAANEHDAVNSNYKKALEVVMILTLPAAFGMAFLANEITHILFERGEFSAEATSATANALIIYSFGLPAFALNKVFASAFFAMKDTKTPMNSAIIALVVNVVLNIAFVLIFPKIGLLPHLGIALATSIAAYLNILYLYIKLKAHAPFALDRIFFFRHLKIFYAALLMVFFIEVLKIIFDISTITLAINISISGAAYAFAILYFKLIEISEIKSFLSRKKKVS